jgi:hypothetical protein
MFYPDSSFKSFWDITSFLFVLYQSILLPFKLSFDVPIPEGLIYFDVVQDAFFLMDVVMNFNTGIYKKGVLLM